MNLATRRLPAEWEPQSAVQLSFPHEHSDWAASLAAVMPCFLEIAATVSRFERVLIVCPNARQAKTMLKDARADNLLFAEIPTNDTWARDHGGITIAENGQPVVLDFMFNGWGLKFPADKDNLVPAALYEQGFIQAPMRPGGLTLEGGALESDGRGTLLTTAECLLSPNRNPHLTQAALEDQLKDTFGLQQVLWLHHGYLAGDDTDSHIDTLARFCDPDTIAFVCCPDPHDEHFDALQKMEIELRTFRNAQGQAYRLVALPWPDACFAADGHRLPATYANFLIINGAVLVPTYRVRQDAGALHIIKGVFPDREVIGIDCRELIEQHGSLHCVTMQYPVGVI